MSFRTYRPRGANSNQFRSDGAKPPSDSARCLPKNDIPLPRTVGATFVFASLDVFDWTSSGPSVRYVVIILVLFLAFGLDARESRPSVRLRIGSVAIAVLWVIWMVLVTLAALLDSDWHRTSTIMLVGPVFIAAFTFLFLSAKSGYRRSGRVAAIPHAAATIFAVVSLLGSVAALTVGTPVLLNHEKAFLAIVVFCLPYSRFFWVTKIVTALSVIISSAVYPSATTLIAFLIGAAGYIVLKRFRPKPGMAIIVVACTVLMLLATYLDNILADFYSAVGRQNNTDTRVSLWNQAFALIAESPLTGTLGRGPITGIGIIRGEHHPVPFHNAYLTVAVYGGTIAAALLIVLLLALVWNGIAAKQETRRVSIIWLPALLAAGTSMIVNPVLEKLGTAIAFFTLVILGFLIVPARRNK